MNAKAINQILQPSAARWPFQRHLAALLPILTLCLFGCLQPTSAQVFTRITNELHFAQSDAGVIVWFDYDKDGWADVLCSGGWKGGYGNRLFHNNRDETFRQVEDTNFAGKGTGTFWSTVADFNDDGFLDVIAGSGSETANGNPVLYLNQGGSRFTKITLDPSTILGGTDVRAWGGAALDYNGDGFVDLALARIDTSRKNYLLKNTGGGMFSAITNTAWTLQSSSDPVSSADYDADGASDLLGLGNSRALLFRNAGAGDFTPVTTNLLSSFQSASSLNSAWGDFDNDGDLDVAITYVSDAPKDLQVFLNDDSGNFALGFSAAVVCQNVYCADYDNDGRLDIYATGFNSRSHLYRNLGGGAFTEVLNEPPVQDSFGQWPTAGWGDYNNDGFMDLLVGATGSINTLYRNSTNANHWLKVKLAGQASNRAAIGAVVRVKANIGGQEVWQMRVVQAQSGLADLVPHFGLGDATNIDLVRIEWPSGNVQELTNIALDQILTATEAVGITPVRPTASLNGSVTLTRSAVASATYQWQFNGLDLAGQTNRVLNLTNIIASQEGRYSVVVSNSSTLATNYVYLYVDPTFVRQPPLVGHTDMFMPYWVDLTGDGWLELVVAGGNLLVYTNSHDGTLSLSLTHDLGKVPLGSILITWADLDNDGDLDAFVGQLETSPAVYLRNDGGGHFTKIVADRSWAANGIAVYGEAPTSADFDNDGNLDLVVGYWGNRANGVWGTNSVLRGLGDGRFEVDRSSPLALSHTWLENWSWADWNADGRLDLFGATSWDSTTVDLMFENLGDGQFLRITNSPLVRTPYFDIAASWGDYNNDGRLDVCIPSPDTTNQLWRSLGGGVFEPDPATPVFPVGQSREMAAWGDYDNDGWLDLIISHQDRPSRLFHNRGDGTFEEITTGSPVKEAKGYGAAWGDYDNDGFLDLCVGVDVSRTYLYRNNLRQVGNTNGWLKVKLAGTASNRYGIGATIRVKATIGGREVWQMRQIVCQSYESALLAHFGLGDATNIDLVRIEWPSGNVQELANVAPDQKRTVSEVVNITPVRPTASLNGSVTLTRSAVASASYQWQFNGADLAGKTNRILNLTNIVAGQEGRYSVVVSNATTLTTNFVYLFVDPTFTKITEGPLVTDRGNDGYISWADYDGDGYPDISNARWKVGTSAVYHNSGDGTFARIAPLPFMKPTDGINPWADMDNDGRLDMMVWGETGGTVLCFDDGQGNWSSYRFGSGSPIWWSIALVDYNQDGFLDVYFTNFGNSNNRLYRNNGNRTFTLTSASDIGALANVSSFGGAAWADFDDDSWPDLYAGSMQANRSLMFRNDGTGHFVAVSNLVTATAGPALSGAWGDYDNDGRLDLFVARFNGTSMLYRNIGGGQFERNISVPALTGTHNSASWADYNNDGFLDLFVSGYTIGNKLFLNNGGGSFTQITTGSIVTDRAIAGAGTYQGMWFDYDRDGFLDLYVGNGDDGASLQAANFLYHNNPNSNHWLDVRLVGTTSNPSGFGAKVRAQARFAGQNRWQRRDITAGDFYNGNNLIAHFGLSTATNVTTLRIEWPSGTVQVLYNVAADQILTVIEPRRPVLAVAITPAQVTGTLTGDTNQVYELQVSNDMDAGWTSLTTVTTDASGKGNWTDAGVAPQGRRFYKAVRAP